MKILNRSRYRDRVSRLALCVGLVAPSSALMPHRLAARAQQVAPSETARLLRRALERLPY
jgi:hypothetical protein